MKIKDFVDVLSGDAFSAGRYRKCDIYRSVLNQVFRFDGSGRPSLEEVFTPAFLTGLQEDLLMGGLARNTASFYMRELHSIFSAAANAGKLPRDPTLFSSVFTGSVPTEKRAASADAVARIHAADLSAYPRLEECRCLFMISLCLQGISFVDLLHLREKDISGDLLFYSRRKTGANICAFVLGASRWYLACLLKVVAEIRAENGEEALTDTPYLLPYVTLPGQAGYTQYQSALHRYNRNLKELAAHLGIEETLSSYVARHTWASLAHSNGVEIAVISQAMGHKTEEMTHVYLSGLGQEHLKSANQTVLDAVLRPIREGAVSDVRKEVREEIRRSAKKQTRKQKRKQTQTQKQIQAQKQAQKQAQIRMSAKPVAQPSPEEGKYDSLFADLYQPLAGLHRPLTCADLRRLMPEEKRGEAAPVRPGAVNNSGETKEYVSRAQRWRMEKERIKEERMEKERIKEEKIKKKKRKKEKKRKRGKKRKMSVS